MMQLAMGLCAVSVGLGAAWAAAGGAGAAEEDALFRLAQEKKQVLRVSTLVMAQDISRRLGDEAAIDEAIDWCRKTGVTRIFLESYRSGRQADRDQLIGARDRFEAAGIEASGCVTTLRLNVKPGRKKGQTDCFADEQTRKKLAEIFEFTAGIFDEIIIDDFFYTKCECDSCTAGKGAGDWSSFRRRQMMEVSRTCVLEPARAANPRVRIIIKYPNWFDNFQNFGYDTAAQTEAFDGIWAGTETREPDNARWGAVQQFRGFFIMRWVAALNRVKAGGGWFDEIDTGPDAYIEQARQTVLGGAREMMLFNYAALRRPARAEHMARLRRELPDLIRLAEVLRGRPARGVAGVKPPNSDPGSEYGVYEFLGMMGLPVAPALEVPAAGEAASVFLPTQAAADPNCPARLTALTEAGAAVLITDGLAAKLAGHPALTSPNVTVLKVAGDPPSLLKLGAARVAELRRAMLEPLGARLDAPTRVAMYLFGDDAVALENFNDEPADVALSLSGVETLAGELALPADAEVSVRSADGRTTVSLPPRSMVLLKAPPKSFLPAGVFLSARRLATLKSRIAEQREPTWSAWVKLKKQADAALTAAPHAPKRWHVPGYYHDAEGHRTAKRGLQDDANRAYTLALAWRMTGDDRYAAAAAGLIDAWPATVETMSRKADSTLSFSYHFPAMIFAADLLDDFDGWPEANRQAFRRFVREKALPMNTMAGRNNWGNWGLVLAASCASYLGDRDLFNICVERWKDLLVGQVAADGHLPHEVTRSKGRHGIWYSHFCLMPQTLAAEILRLGGVNLFDWRTPGTGRTLELAFHKLAPWVRRPETFPYWAGDPKDLAAPGYFSYFELLQSRWPHPDVAALLERDRPLTASHSAPHLSFTHGALKEDAPAP